MPLAIPWLLGAAGLGAAGGIWVTNSAGKLMQWAVIGGIAYIWWEGHK